MEMPTPCYKCGELTELNDLRGGECKSTRLFCYDCFERHIEDCEKCEEWA